jgi:hypothetical protein
MEVITMEKYRIIITIFFLWWPNVNKLESAKKAVRFGVWAASGSAGVTAVSAKWPSAPLPENQTLLKKRFSAMSNLNQTRKNYQ